MNFCQMCTRLFDRADASSMKFDDFIQCCVMLRSLTESFQRMDTDRDGVIDVSYEQVTCAQLPHWFVYLHKTSKVNRITCTVYV